MNGIILQNEPVDYLDGTLLDDAGRLRLLPSDFYAKIPRAHLMLWCHRKARYTLPTLELVEWLRFQIVGRTALEVGAGNGDLGHLLGIPATDSYIQQAPGVREGYRLMRQVPTNPPPDVECLDALAAILKYRPQVVIASWLTRKFEIGKDVDGSAQASVYGVREEEILQLCETYIHIGNERVHGEKTIRRMPHQEIRAPWLVSRSMVPAANVIYQWGP